MSTKRHKLWTHKEDNLFRDLWPFATRKELLLAFPGRTYMALKVHAQKLGVRRSCQKRTVAEIQGRPLKTKPGQQYGMLIVLEHSEPNNFIKHNRPQWLCQCECGKKKIVSGQYLRKALNPSCGCNTNSKIKNRKYDNPQEVTINSVLSNYRGKAKRRNLKWELTRQQFKDLVVQRCYYCQSEPTTIKNVYKQKHPDRHRACQEWSKAAAIKLNGIDRLNNTKGYVLENCVPCCEICNKAKRNLTEEEFVSWIQRLIAVFGK
jgi:hypothetical protein